MLSKTAEKRDRIAWTRYKNGHRMTLRDWQIVKICQPSGLWHDYFPKFLKKNGVSIHGRYTPSVWQALFDVATEEYTAMLDKLALLHRPTLKIGNRNIAYQL